MNLYWVETEDHDEDWFIVALSKQAAERVHEKLEGYGDGDARAKLVVAVPPSIAAAPGWPSNAVLEACGAEFVRRSQPRVVKIAGQSYAEGMLQQELDQRADDLFEAHGDRRRNGTARRGVGQ